ncbi:MAG: RNA polymerase sigma factor [Anaerolineae bacterium]
MISAAAETLLPFRRACMNRPRPNERALIEQARAHDESAFAALVEMHAAPLFRIVHRMLADDMETEAIVQETFWRFWQVLPRYRSDQPLLPYLATIASNLARDRHRRDRRIDDIPVDDLLESVPLESDISVEQWVEDESTMHTLSRLVQELPFNYRAVIALRYEADMSYEQIAASLSLPVNTVRTHLRRAKQLLRRRLEEAGNG